jgi:hypothetical protein
VNRLSGADPNNPRTWELIEPVRMTDYVGPTPYGEAELTVDAASWSASETMRYLLPAGQETVAGEEFQYYHDDLIGSTMLTTDESGAPSLPGVGDGVLTYSAFGKVLDASGSPGGSAPADFPRYQYAGACGYEAGGYAGQGAGGGGGAGEPDLGFGDERHLLCLYGVNPNLPPITVQHVGYRWYDPALGRFVQRDPIGIAGGQNVYGYVHADPLAGVDPDGRGVLSIFRVVRKGIRRAWRWITKADKTEADKIFVDEGHSRWKKEIVYDTETGLMFRRDKFQGRNWFLNCIGPDIIIPPWLWGLGEPPVGGGLDFPYPYPGRGGAGGVIIN